MALLEVGDKVASENFGRWNLYTIKKVTKTQAISDDIKFRREHNDGWVRVAGVEYTWSTTTYRLADQEIIDKVNKYRLVQWLKNKNFDECDLNTLRKIVSLTKANANSK